jgi:hypothetical protein
MEDFPKAVILRMGIFGCEEVFTEIDFPADLFTGDHLSGTVLSLDGFTACSAGTPGAHGSRWFTGILR